MTKVIVLARMMRPMKATSERPEDFRLATFLDFDPATTSDGDTLVGGGVTCTRKTDPFFSRHPKSSVLSSFFFSPFFHNFLALLRL